MKKICFLSLLIIFNSALCYSEVLYIDFGDSLTSPVASGWNADIVVDETSYLDNDNEDATGIEIITDEDFSGSISTSWSAVINVWMDDDANAFTDALFNNTAISTIVFDNLDDNASYTLELVSSYYTGSFTAHYLVNGEWADLIVKNIDNDPDEGQMTVNDCTLINCGQNYNAQEGNSNNQWLKWNSVTPVSRVITITVNATACCGFVNAIRLENPSGPLFSKFTSFDAMNIDNSIEISWKTLSEINLSSFSILRSEAENGIYENISTDSIPVLGSDFSGESYSFIDSNVILGQTYYYKIESIDNDGLSTFEGPISITYNKEYTEELTSTGCAYIGNNPTSPILFLFLFLFLFSLFIARLVKV
ncbi:MAG: hypothetical protein ABIA04_11195 [Pseudomonadota bacterium]